MQAFLFSMALCFLSLSLSAQSSFIQNKVIAHRGAWKKNELPQNSIASLREAIRLGCEGSEFDVWMTADEVLVINHDVDFQGLDIEHETYETLLSKKLPNGEKIPTLEEYLREGMKQKKTKLILEFKPSEISTERSERVGELAVLTVQKLQAQDWVEYITFSYEGGLKAIATDPTAKVAYLTGDKSPAELKEAGFYGFDYNFRILQLKPNWIEEARQLGLTTNSWTVNDPEVMQFLLDKKIDFITTDEPETLLKMVGK
ncbi:glycerophosphodiester phosphodiesterase family protein [Algoriphagus sp. NF]|uniref:glycerophosphodiester phosphodiesterase n=1 Tax=Algoriphagus sp. NF TaxID=2992756 RepID=UPI00237AC39E|nr:glycerophosphodiester phosphodiesterase family protein [Algoriphagus sp. NF]MDE0560301.1 glycerophosphodiester phosphodiesterase family protein [Algoriphagus sp. NF]